MSPSGAPEKMAAACAFCLRLNLCHSWRICFVFHRTFHLESHRTFVPHSMKAWHLTAFPWSTVTHSFLIVDHSIRNPISQSLIVLHDV